MLHCVVSINLRSASHSAGQSEPLLVREIQRKRVVLKAEISKREIRGYSLVNKNEGIEGGSWFQSAGPMKQKCYGSNANAMVMLVF